MKTIIVLFIAVALFSCKEQNEADNADKFKQRTMDSIDIWDGKIEMVNPDGFDTIINLDMSGEHRMSWDLDKQKPIKNFTHWAEITPPKT